MWIFESIKYWIVVELCEFILFLEIIDFDIKWIFCGFILEMIVVVCKLMFNMDLIVGVKKINIEKIVNIIIGCFGIFLNCL